MCSTPPKSKSIAQTKNGVQNSHNIGGQEESTMFISIVPALQQVQTGWIGLMGDEKGFRSPRRRSYEENILPFNDEPQRWELATAVTDELVSNWPREETLKTERQEPRERGADAQVQLGADLNGGVLQLVRATEITYRPHDGLT